MHAFRVTLLALAISSSLAAGVAQAADGIAAAARSGLSEDVAGPSSAPGTWNVIYSTFNDNRDHLYNERTAWAFVGAKAPEATHFSQAMPFTAAADGVIHKIVVAIGIDGGADNRVSLALHEDADGLPGNIIRRFQPVGVPPAWQCCQTVAVGIKGVPIIAGKQYWVALSARGDTQGIWYMNDIALYGPLAHESNGEWSLANGKIAAFSVLGD